MACNFSCFRAFLLFCFLFCCSLQRLSVLCFEFQVGGPKGWVVPPSNDSKTYIEWASQNRFQLGDTLLMEVTEEDYKKCNSSRPNFFSNTGDTLFRLDHYGPFYFISGVSGHCEKGQCLIIKVKTPDEQSPLSDAAKSSASPLVVSSLQASKLALSFVVCCFCCRRLVYS